MHIAKELGKLVVFVLNRNDVESAVRHFICACHPEFATGYTINVPVPKLDLNDDPFMLTAATEQPYKEDK